MGRLHLTRFGICVRAGYAVEYHHPRGGKESGIVARIAREGFGADTPYRVTLTSGASCTLDDIAAAAPVVLKWQDVNPRAYPSPTVLLVDFGHADGKPRYCIVGAAYGYLHTTSGDIHTWRSYGGARRVARSYT